MLAWIWRKSNSTLLAEISTNIEEKSVEVSQKIKNRTTE